MIVFVADFFVNEILGGGELNNEEFIQIAAQRLPVKKINSHNVTLNFLYEYRDANFVIANYINLRSDAKDYITNNLSYVIYEHDHKYLVNRNPALFEDFVAPKEALVNYDFCRRAKAVLCQSAFHSNIVRKNLNLSNIVNLGGNLWSKESLDAIEQYSNKEKKDVCSIMDSQISHKNTREAVLYCKHKNLEYELIGKNDYLTFLDKLSNNNKLVFFPKTPETLSRIVVEARMMGMSTITNKIIGATGEEWFSMKGKDLVDHMREKRTTITNTILNIF